MGKWIGIAVWMYGLLLGSFYNVVGLRLPEGKLFEKSRSYCPRCKRTLRWKELVPLVSFLLQKGRCRGCKGAISPAYPFFEVLTASLFWLSWVEFGFSLKFLLAVLLISFLIPLTISDLEYMKIPNRLLLFFGPLLVVLARFALNIPFGSRLLAVGLITAVFSVVFIFQKNGMGMGDVKLLLLLGCIFGADFVLYTLFLSSTLALMCFAAIYFRNGKVQELKIPFGPFIAAAVLIVLFNMY